MANSDNIDSGTPPVACFLVNPWISVTKCPFYSSLWIFVWVKCIVCDLRLRMNHLMKVQWRVVGVLKAYFFSYRLFCYKDCFSYGRIWLLFPATEQLFFQLYFSDTIEIIEVVKNYLDDAKKGMSCSCIIVYDNSKNDNNNNYKIYNNDSIHSLKILKSTMIKEKMITTKKKFKWAKFLENMPELFYLVTNQFKMGPFYKTHIKNWITFGY